MIDYKKVQDLAGKLQTSEENILREYLQHLFLSYFYQQEKSDKFLFKGGTALRIVFQSPRFSEDLDFSEMINGERYEKILEAVLVKLDQEGIVFDLEESKATSGGWLAIIEFRLFERKLKIKNEVSFRKKPAEKEDELISSNFVPSYHISYLSPKFLVEEKIAALLARQKQRDIFDLYFIIQNQDLRKHFNPIFKRKKEEIKNLLKNVSAKELEVGLLPLMPISYKRVVKNLAKKLLDKLF